MDYSEIFVVAVLSLNKYRLTVCRISQ